MDSQIQIELSRAFNRVGIQEILTIKSISDIRRMKQHFKSVENVGDDTILAECRRIQKNHPKVLDIKSLPVIEQRSEEWYRIRDQMITASDFGQALGVGKFGTVQDFYIKKCGHQAPPPFYTGCLGHGIRYEPVATRAYELDMSTTVHEFGLLQHPELQFLGASPDGITDHGIMIEIKCPFKRKITGDIVDQYYYQMQGQLDVCNLDVCHFLECKIDEYMDEIDFQEDWDVEKKLSADGCKKGVVIEFENNGGEPVYSEPGITAAQYKIWFKNQMRLFHSQDFVVIYYKLTQYSLQTVERDEQFLRKMNEQLGEVWSNIESYKKDKSKYDEEVGFKRPPTKRRVKCLFDSKKS